MNPEILRRSFPKEQIKERTTDDGKVLHYVDVSRVIERLNEGCSKWDFEIERYEIRDEEVVVLGRLIADGIVKSAFGGTTVTRNASGKMSSLADDLKAGASDALKKAASLLGVGLELYGGSGANEGRRGLESRQSRRPAQPLGNAPERATLRQINRIQSASRRKGLTNDRLTALVANQTGKYNLALLTKAEASTLIDTLDDARGNSH